MSSVTKCHSWGGLKLYSTVLGTYCRCKETFSLTLEVSWNFRITETSSDQWDYYIAFFLRILLFDGQSISCQCLYPQLIEERKAIKLQSTLIIKSHFWWHIPNMFQTPFEHKWESPSVFKLLMIYLKRLIVPLGLSTPFPKATAAWVKPPR